MNIERVRKEQHFTVLDNALIRDARLSFGARGLLVYLLSLPDNVKVTIKDLAKNNPEGRARIATCMRELESVGYLVRAKKHGPGGRLVTTVTVYEEPAPYRGPGFRAPVDRAPVSRAPKEEELTTEELKEGRAEAQPPLPDADELQGAAVGDAPRSSVAVETKSDLSSLDQRSVKIARECCDRYPLNNFQGVRTTVRAALKAGVSDDTVRRTLRAMCERNDPISINSFKVELNGGFRPRLYDDPRVKVHDSSSLPPAAPVAVAAPNDEYRAAREASRRTT